MADTLVRMLLFRHVYVASTAFGNDSVLAFERAGIMPGSFVIVGSVFLYHQLSSFSAIHWTARIVRWRGFG